MSLINMSVGKIREPFLIALVAATLSFWVECTLGATSQVDFNARGKNANQKPLKFNVASSSS